jgi:hypothetical protein
MAAPIIGKTYSLYGGEGTSDGFFVHLGECADEVLTAFGGDLQALLDLVTNISSSKRRLKKALKSDGFAGDMMNLLSDYLSVYLTDVEGHLKSVSLWKKRERAMRASADQYLLYMLEIELTNRLYFAEFRSSVMKLAFLPHCLKDFDKGCKASPDGIDYLCRKCSGSCDLRVLSETLNDYNVMPYILMDADLKKLFREYRREGVRVGVLGIACIPELVYGMRKCRAAGVPVIGVPLDANRCVRWMGDFYDNSVNIEKLRSMVG